MEKEYKKCCCLTNDRDTLKSGIQEYAEKLTAEGLQELYLKAMMICGGEKAEATVKEKMIQYIVERMQEADAEKVRTLFLCATNIL